MTEQEFKQTLDAIERGPQAIAAAVAGVETSTLDYKPAPGKWSIREIVAHLADVEILYGYRMRQMLADKDPVIAPIDQDDWARNLNYRTAPVSDSLALHSAARRVNVRLLRQISVADLGRGAFHPEKQRKVTLDELLGMMAGHDPNHLAQIEKLKEQAREAAR